MNSFKHDFNSARAKIGKLKGVLRALGDAPEHDHKWGSLPKCPFCDAKDCSGVWEKDGTEFFKCHKPACSSGGVVMTEVGYIAAREGLSETKPVGGGPSPAYERFLKLAGCWQEPEAVKPPEAPEAKLDPVLVDRAEALVLAQRDASVRLLRAELKVGQPTALALLAALEHRGVVGPSRPSAARQIILKDLKNLPASAGVPVPPEQNVAGGTRPGGGDPAPVVGPPAMSANQPPVHVDGVAPSQSPPATSPPPVPPPKEDEVVPLRPGLAVLRAFYERRTPAASQKEAVRDAAGKLTDQFVTVSLFKKRGLMISTCDALGLAANPRSNFSILQELYAQYPWSEMAASGLWLEADPRRKLPRRPNTQFCGKGCVAKKPKAARKEADDKVIWGWCEPVLIPYFDNLGQLIKLRPHKGGAAAGTAAGAMHMYVPRVRGKAGDTVEKFDKVFICEGEYKACVLWQEIGPGAEELDGEPPMGAVALPGISYVKTEMVDEIEEWLREVGCKEAAVAFDNEDTSPRPMRQRHAAEIHARFLAEELMSRLNIPVVVSHLPDSWRINGKADFDSHAAVVLNQE